MNPRPDFPHLLWWAVLRVTAAYAFVNSQTSEPQNAELDHCTEKCTSGHGRAKDKWTSVDRVARARIPHVILGRLASDENPEVGTLLLV